MFLDTCFLIDIMRESKKGIEGSAIKKLQLLEGVILNISLFTVCELMGGVEKSSNSQRERSNVEFLLEHLRVIYPEIGFAVSYGEIYGYLARNGIMIPQMDLLIACHAKILNMPLITKDVDHFKRIKGLVVESY